MTAPIADIPTVLYADLPMSRDRGAGWAKLRDLGPVLYGDGWYYLTRRDDILTALRTPEVFSSRIGYDDMISPVPLVPLGFDPPDHTRYRRILHPFFSPQTLGALLPSLQAQAAGIVAEIATQNECEVMAELATPYPSQVFLTLFGLPLEDRERLIAWKDAIIAFSLTTDPDSVDLTPAAELFGYLTRSRCPATGQPPRRHPVTPAARRGAAHRQRSDRAVPGVHARGTGHRHRDHRCRHAGAGTAPGTSRVVTG